METILENFEFSIFQIASKAIELESRLICGLC